MEQATALGRLVVPDELVAAVAGRHAIATAAIAGLVRPGGGAGVLGIRHLARGVGVSGVGPRLRLVVYAAARFGAEASELDRAAKQTADGVAASVGGNVGVEVEIRVVAVRTRRRLGQASADDRAEVKERVEMRERSEGPRA